MIVIIIVGGSIKPTGGRGHMQTSVADTQARKFITHFKVDQQRLKARVSEKEIKEMAKDLVNWEAMSGHLGLTNTDIATIIEGATNPVLRRLAYNYYESI